MKPVYVRQNPTLPSHIHEEKGKALCGDKARPAIYIYIYDLVSTIKPFVGFTCNSV